MPFTIPVFLDFITSLSLLGLLALAFSHARRWLAFPRVGQLFLGVVFGAAAALQMSLPLEPMPGLIIDMRNVPLALCGAFLGWRAALTCLVIAVATRAGIGGIGMWAGIAAMGIAMFMGRLWARLTAGAQRRGSLHMLGLALMMSCHLFAAMILPEPAMGWFVAEALVPLLVLNLIAIPIAANLLEAEMRNQQKERRMLAGIWRDPENGLMTLPAFQRDLEMRIAAGVHEDMLGRDKSGAHRLGIIRLRHPGLVRNLVPMLAGSQVLGLVHRRLCEIVPGLDRNCAVVDGALIFVLSDAQIAGWPELQVQMRRAVSETPFDVISRLRLRLRIDSWTTAWRPGSDIVLAASASREHGAALGAVSHYLRRSTPNDGRPQGRALKPGHKAVFGPVGLETIFDEAEKRSLLGT